MNALDAAYEVLHAAGEPLHYREITQRMLDRGLWSSAGLTPWDSVNARITVDIKKNGEQSRFYRAAPGIFGCREAGDHLPSPEPDPGPASLSFLDADALSNYIYLCTEMTALLGGISICDAAVGTQDVAGNAHRVSAYPNPFSTHLRVTPVSNEALFELTNALGQVVFSGKNIAQQDFSGLPDGAYFLKISEASIEVLKLEKHSAN